MSVLKEKTVNKQTLDLLIRILKRIFKDPCVVAIEGEWKTGKTDLALYVSELLLSNNIVDEVASNIETFGTFPNISDLQNLKFWLHRNKLKKCYIMDELNTNAPSRRAMSNKSVGIISILPECSKAHSRVIGIAQDFEGVDSEFRKSVWVKAHFEKQITKESRVKTVQVNSQLLSHSYRFSDIPRTAIKFDPDLIAPFTIKPTENMMFKDENIAKLSEWANGKPWRELFPHPQACNRFVRREVKNLLNLYSQFPVNSVSGSTQGTSEQKQ